MAKDGYEFRDKTTEELIQLIVLQYRDNQKLRTEVNDTLLYNKVSMHLSFVDQLGQLRVENIKRLSLYLVKEDDMVNKTNDSNAYFNLKEKNEAEAKAKATAKIHVPLQTTDLIQDVEPVGLKKVKETLKTIDTSAKITIVMIIIIFLLAPFIDYVR